MERWEGMGLLLRCERNVETEWVACIGCTEERDG